LYKTKRERERERVRIKSGTQYRIVFFFVFCLASIHSQIYPSSEKELHKTNVSRFTDWKIEEEEEGTDIGEKRKKKYKPQ
jgi:hypothetical protein